jgi:hypothetical protein
VYMTAIVYIISLSGSVHDCSFICRNGFCFYISPPDVVRSVHMEIMLFIVKVN